MDVTIELTAVKRQSDSAFIDLLSSVRRGECSKRQEQVLRDTENNKVLYKVSLFSIA